MKNGLAAWHYPHRTVLENVKFFAENGFNAVSLLGYHMDDICKNGEDSAALAALVSEYGLTLTVHHKMPATHGERDVAEYQAAVDNFAKWQKEYGTLAILSFDVPDAIRDNVTGYIKYVLQAVPDSRIAVEDFGLTAAERAQIEELKKEPRFGYLLDVGHMFLRIRGENTEDYTLFHNQQDECPRCSEPGYEEFMRAFRTKEFSIYEIHMHNNDGVSDLHQFLENGKLNVQAVAAVLRDLKWDGVLTIESAPGYTFPCYGDDADKGILATYEIWKSCTYIERNRKGGASQ